MTNINNSLGILYFLCFFVILIVSIIKMDQTLVNLATIFLIGSTLMLKQEVVYVDGRKP